RYRIGDFRLLCKIEDNKVVVVVVQVGNRKDVYKKK
ncbi:MAG: type II toxin-antitoxin system RelE/ParE family toxin, partial [Clostridiales bacterium]|nr:type II toxin-antitoxin system RelE/ParE family toxin [Clostridiales bacterium]